MKVAKVKVMASNKTYWLTERQADVIAEMTQSGNHNSRLIPLGGDRVKLSAIKAIEIEEEPDINIAPEYFKEALRKENQGALRLHRGASVMGMERLALSARLG